VRYLDSTRVKKMTEPGARRANVVGDAALLPPPHRGADTVGMVAPPPTYWTADMVRALPDDGNRYEVVHGELLVTPSPRLPHQAVVTRLAVALSNYLERQPVGVVLVSPADISWGRRDVLVQPDVFVVTREEARTGEWDRLRRLPLVIEVLSPSTARADRFVKRRRYQEAGVPLYWIVDAEHRQIEVWTPEAEFPHIERETLAWHPTGAAAPFRLELEDLFRPV
jgi:Uma2 family endonuclease